MFSIFNIKIINDDKDQGSSFLIEAEQIIIEVYSLYVAQASLSRLLTLMI
jgi:hypothetical protein